MSEINSGEKRNTSLDLLTHEELLQFN